MRDFSFIQTASQRLFVGWGPFEQLPFRRPERPAFYVTDFFLDDPHPWRHPAEWEEISVDEFAAKIGAQTFLSAPGVADKNVCSPLRVDWHPAPNEDFARLFRSAQEAMARGVFNKIVPIVFESGEATADPRQWLINELKSLPGGMWAYGYSYHSHGMIGATPELLFRSERRGYATMALAGTRPVARAEELLRDPKELREHRFVVDDIVRRLAPFGNLELGPLGVMRLPNIAHLITPIYFAENGAEKMSFAEMIRRLHPTAALGVSPRNEAGERWLREADRGVKRRSFGAPFGLEREDRSALAVVSIRNVQWQGTSLRVGSGAGLLPESQLERELDELRQKRAQVKALFGLDALVHA
ncbi:MAG TPA: chorismate-binding protein [Thermoanaerobaculia bacterium]|nr:chorismate-binding protein [Thermoanaerobaculia bacterium]